MGCRSLARLSLKSGQILEVLAARFAFMAPRRDMVVTLFKTRQWEPIRFGLLGNFICS